MATKTINLTGAEVAVTGLDGAHAHIRNDGTDVIYAAKAAGITAGADGVLGIPAGQAATVYGISGTVYMLGTGSAQIISNDYSELPFKTSATSGGSGADEVARAAINAHSGNAEIHVTASEKTSWNDKAELTDIPTTLPANGGNADTLDGKHASEFSQNKVITTLDEVNNPNLESGIYSVENVSMEFPYGSNGSGVRNDYFVLIVNQHRNILGFGSQIAIPYTNGEMVGVFYRNCAAGTWNTWKNIADGGNAAMLESHPASDFVLKSDYDALAARVAALEGGTT